MSDKQTERDHKSVPDGYYFYQGTRIDVYAEFREKYLVVQVKANHAYLFGVEGGFALDELHGKWKRVLHFPLPEVKPIDDDESIAMIP